MKTTITISVPLRGLWFLSGLIEETQEGIPVMISVPLRGLWFLSNGSGLQNYPRPFSFPSPCGDYGSYHT